MCRRFSGISGGLARLQFQVRGFVSSAVRQFQFGFHFGFSNISGGFSVVRWFGFQSGFQFRSRVSSAFVRKFVGCSVSVWFAGWCCVLVLVLQFMFLVLQFVFRSFPGNLEITLGFCFSRGFQFGAQLHFGVLLGVSIFSCVQQP